MTGLWIALGVGAVLAVIVVTMYNTLVRSRIETQNGWSQIEVQLKRRYDLIPNLVETVKGYAKHEADTLEKVVQARNQAMGAQGQGPQAQASAENALSGTLKTLFALSEAYPDLKANTNFLALQEELTATENRIGFARQNYNDTVTNYNGTLGVFPNNVIGGMFGFRPAEFFQLDAAERAAAKEAPKVKF